MLDLFSRNWQNGGNWTVVPVWNSILKNNNFKLFFRMASWSVWGSDVGDCPVPAGHDGAVIRVVLVTDTDDRGHCDLPRPVLHRQAECLKVTQLIDSVLHFPPRVNAPEGQFATFTFTYVGLLNWRPVLRETSATVTYNLRLLLG